MRACLPACVSTCLHACLPACLLACCCLSARLFSFFPSIHLETSTYREEWQWKQPYCPFLDDRGMVSAYLFTNYAGVILVPFPPSTTNYTRDDLESWSIQRSRFLNAMASVEVIGFRFSGITFESTHCAVCICLHIAADVIVHCLQTNQSVDQSNVCMYKCI